VRLVAISNVKNEIDIVEAFVRHTAAFADHLLVLDNGSSDGTRDVLAALVGEGLALTVVDDPSPGAWQRERMTRLMRSAATEMGADWVVPLDADEFLVAKHWPSLRRQLRGHRDPVLVPWRTYVPAPSDDPGEINPVLRIQHRLRLEGLESSKVMVPGHIAAVASLDQGSHDLTDAEPATRTVLNRVMLAHFPVRSVAQLARKVAVGKIQYLARGYQYDWGFHYDESFAMLVRDWDEFAASFFDLAGRFGLRLGSEFEPDLIEDPLEYAGGPLRHTPSQRVSEPLRTILEYTMQLAEHIGRSVRKEGGVSGVVEAVGGAADAAR